MGGMTPTQPETVDQIERALGTELVALYDMLGLMRIQDRLAMAGSLEREPGAVAEMSWRESLRRVKLDRDVERWADVKHGLAAD